MLEAAHADLVSPSARSAAPSIFSYPQERRPVTPSLGPCADGMAEGPFADGIAEDVITELSRFWNLFVICLLARLREAGAASRPWAAFRGEPCGPAVWGVCQQPGCSITRPAWHSATNAYSSRPNRSKLSKRAAASAGAALSGQPDAFVDPRPIKHYAGLSWSVTKCSRSSERHIERGIAGSTSSGEPPCR
jgi:hypothetical protein